MAANRLRWCRLIAILAVSSAANGWAMCGRPLDSNNFKRPIDINDPGDAPEIKLVHDGHFNEDVFALRKGTSSYTPEHDLDYTLKHIPNHYRALDAMGRWRLKNRPTSQNYYTAECYFDRATTFRPTDPRLRFLFGLYFQRGKRYDEARVQYAKAEELGGDNAELYYNWGLLEFEAGNIPKARELADKAYAMGFPLPGLRNKLRGASVKSTKR